MTDYEKLKSIVDEADSLSKKEVRWKNPEVQAWYNKTERWLIKYFGDPSQEINSFRKINFQSMLIDVRQDILACKSGLKQAHAILLTYFEDFEDDTENNYRIRHHETDKIDITDTRHYDYFFNRCLSLIALAIQYLN